MHESQSRPNIGAVQRAYRIWPKVHDAVCGPIFRSTRHEAASIARRVCRHVLEIGVGTGLLLGDYGPASTVVGIDIAMEMIANARRRLGLPYWSLSASAKLKVKNAVSYVGDFERFLSEEARKAGASGVICGHIHHAADRDMNGIRYLNTGDWVESGLSGDRSAGRCRQERGGTPRIRFVEGREGMSVHQPIRLRDCGGAIHLG